MSEKKVHACVSVVYIKKNCFRANFLFFVNINDAFSSTEINMKLFSDDACLSLKYSDPACANTVVNKSWERWCMVVC